MPSRNWWLRIQDIVTSINEIKQCTEQLTFEEFANNQTILKAVLYDLVVIRK